MSEGPRNWDKELSDIDKAIAREGSAPPPAVGGGPVPSPARTAPGGQVTRRGHVVLTWFWVCLAIALGTSLLLWPYDKGCGLQLAFFLGAAGTTAVFAVLGALSSWSHRRAFAHVLSLLMLLWAGVAAAHEVLPRTGYAKESRTWLCPSAPSAPTLSPAPSPAR